MKKLFLFLLAMAASCAIQAQWVDNPATNSLIANAPSFSGEIILSTDEGTNDTYVQWVSSSSNGYGPSLQRLTFDGTPQWGDEGIRITAHTFSSSSEGMAMCATTDKAVLSCFANYDGQTIAVKIRTDGSFAWGEQGIVLFDGQGFSRTELIAGDDGGAWALGFDYHKHFMQYINADGSLNPTISIGAEGYNIEYGQMTLGIDNSVFLTYEKCGNGFYTDKEIYVVGYTKEGVQIGPEVQLMASQTFQVTYLHHVVPDGLGGGYAYIWHPGIGSAFNTYVFHYDANGFNTISDPNGVAVHVDDPEHFYLDAYATVDPVTHDLIIAYIQVDSYTQTHDQIFLNRITSTGERVWRDGVVVVEEAGTPYGHLKVDAFEDGSGFSLVYEKAPAINDFNSTIEAIGFDMNGNQIWNKQLSSSAYNRSMCVNSAGYYLGQNIVAWVNGNNGGIYGQNFGTDGTMGHIEPVIPVPSCPAPVNFDGEYIFNMEEQTFGVKLVWEAPEILPIHYNLYRLGISKDREVIEIAPELTEYYDETGIGDFQYQLTAVYDDCESDFALNPEGGNYVLINVTGLPENTDERIVTVTKVYTLNGQLIHNTDTETLSNGVYVIQGLTRNGNLVTRKMVINH